MIFPEIFKLHPRPTTLDRDLLLRCIQECLDCIASCTACADSCLSEDDLADLVRCIRLDLDSHHAQQRAAGDVFFDPRVFEQQLQVHVEDARGAVAALDVTPDPEQALGDAAQHWSPPAD